MSRTLTQWSLVDYHRMIESGLLIDRQVELIEGQILDMAPELPIHRVTYRRAIKYLETLLQNQAVIFSTAPITLKDSEPQPDTAIVIPPESRYDARHPGVDDVYWLIEVSNSTLAYDLGEKARLYARNGILDYWVIDIVGAQLWVHRQPKDGEYQSVERFSSGRISPIALPKVVVEVNKLLLS
jgi:Uma2 family endonuclease